MEDWCITTRELKLREKVYASYSKMNYGTNRSKSLLEKLLEAYNH